MENGVEISGVENTEQLNTRCIQHQKKLLFSGKKGKNTKNGAENRRIPQFLVYKAPGVEYPKKSRNFGLSVSDFQDKSHKISGF